MERAVINMVHTQPEYVLADLREALAAQLTPNTAKRYYQEVLNFFSEYTLEDPANVTPELVVEALHNRSQNACTALHRGLLHLRALDPSVRLPDAEVVEEIRSHKRNRSVRPAKNLYLDDTLKKINHLRNDKLKYALRLMLASGLRVFEVAALEPGDIHITPDGRLQLTVRHGKGDKYDVVTCMEDRYLEKCLPAYLQGLPDGERPFYSAKTMKNKALDLGLECHDLRRMAAQLYRNERLKERSTDTLDAPGISEIDDATRLFLRHERFSTTKRYLYNHKLKIHLPAEPEGGENDGKKHEIRSAG